MSHSPQAQSGWKISQPKIFSKFQGPGNLIYIHDGVFYLWSNTNQTITRALCTDIWNHTQEKDTEQIQTKEWKLSSPIPFKVTSLTVRKNKKNEPVCLLWGMSGGAIITIPILHPQQSGIPTAYSRIIGEKIYLEHSKLQILQAKFHPSIRHEVVLILNNDSYIRCYNLNDPSSSCSVVCVGPPESIPFHYSSTTDQQRKTPIGLVDHDEPPIDFDFGPHLSTNDLWSIFILKGSGAVSYICMKLIEPTKRVHWEIEKTVEFFGDFGDLVEFPTTFWASKTFPIYLTMGSLAGNLYHCVLVPCVSGDSDTGENINIEQEFIHGAQSTTMFVKEVLELEPDSSLGFLQLVQDPMCPHRYACVHPEGVHLITMNWVPGMRKILYGSASASGADKPSTSRHIVYNKGKESGTYNGACFSDLLPQKFVSIDSTEKILSFEIPKFMGLDSMSSSTTTPCKSQKPTTPIDDTTATLTVELEKLLLKKKNQPFLSCGNDIPLPQRENILLESLRTLQTEYVNKQEQAISFIKLSLTHLKEKVDDLKGQPLNELQATKSAIEKQAQKLETKYNEISQIESSLGQRIESVVSTQQHSFPVFTDEEKAWSKILLDLEKELDGLKEQIRGLKDRNKNNPTPTSPLILSSPTPRNVGNKGSQISASELVDIKVQLLQQQKQLAELKCAFKDIEESISA